MFTEHIINDKKQPNAWRVTRKPVIPKEIMLAIAVTALVLSFIAGYKISQHYSKDDWTKGYNECEAIYGQRTD